MIGRVLIDRIGFILSHQIVRVDLPLKIEGRISADGIGLAGQVLPRVRQVKQAEDDDNGRQEPHHRLKPDLEPAQQGTVAFVQGPAQRFRVAHGLDGRLLGFLRGQIGAKLQQSVPVVLQVGGQLGGDGCVVRPEADKAAHHFAERFDGGPGGIWGVHQAMARADPASTALTAWEKVVHSFFFSSSSRRPFLVMW